MILSWSRGCESLEMHLHPHDPSALLPFITHFCMVDHNQSITNSGEALLLPPTARWKKPTPVFLMGESHGQRGLVGYSPGGHSQMRVSTKCMPPHLSSLQSSIYLIYFFYSLLEYSCFTMLCKFLLHGKVNQLCVYKYPFFWISFPSRSPQSIE